jgi:hypothetical protein
MTYKNEQPATVTGGNSFTLEEFVNADYNGDGGTLEITIDSAPLTITGLDFSTAESLDAVAADVEAAIVAEGSALVKVDWNGRSFVVTGGAVGLAGNITAATGTAAASLGLESYQSKASNGIGSESPVDGLNINLTSGVEWVATVTHEEYRDVSSGSEGTTTLEIAQWCEAAKRIFMNTTNDLTTLSSDSSSDVASQLKAASLRFSLTTFSKNPNQYPSASVFGRAASVNFSAVGSTITLNLKQMPGVTAEDLTPGEFQVLRSKYASAVVLIGKSTNAYTDARMASGSWLDTTHGLMWLEARAESDMFNLLFTTTTKIPYTQAGINTCVLTLEGSLNAAVRNGLAAPGFLADGTFLPKGYLVTAVDLADTPAGDVGNRVYKGLSFVMKGAGALQDVEVQGSFTE